MGDVTLHLLEVGDALSFTSVHPIHFNLHAKMAATSLPFRNRFSSQLSILCNAVRDFLCSQPTTTPHPITPSTDVDMASYLSSNPNAPIFGVNALKLWLKGDITTPGFLSSDNGGYVDKGGRDQFSLQELHQALFLAILEISLKLDPKLECVATQASGLKYCIAIDFDEFYEGRDTEVKSLVDLDSGKRDEIISTYDREATCEVLEQAREEIGWLENQGRRLEVHMETADAMKRARSRIAFVFRPLERSWATARGSKDVEMLDVDALETDVRNGEDKDIPEEDNSAEEVVESTEEPEQMEQVPVTGQENTAEERQRQTRKERLELFKREADVGFGTGIFEGSLEEGAVQEKTDSPLVGLGVEMEGEGS